MQIYIYLIFGFVILIKGADFLVDGSVSVAKRLKISNLVIGLTVVAFGTSSPELFVNILSSFKGASDITVGNILGSNIFNTFFILGISAIIFPLSVNKGTVYKEIPFNFFSVIILGLLVNDFFIGKPQLKILSNLDGVVFLVFFTLFILYTFSIAKKNNDSEDHIIKPVNFSKSLILIVLGLVLLVFGSKLIVDSAITIALKLKVSQSLIALTIVAMGTSLPELATSVVAAFKKHIDIAVGNVIGSNIFNILFILGISSLIKPIPFKESSNFEILITLCSAVLVFVSMFTGKKKTIDRWEGIVFVIIYVIFIICLILRG